MPEQQRPKPQPIQIGQGQFTAPVSNDDRGPDETISNATAAENLAMYGDPYGYYGWMYGYGDPSPWLAETDEKWGEVQQTTLEQLTESGMLREYGEDAILVIANGPEDMKRLDHAAEAENIASGRPEDQETVVLWNPSPEALAAMLQQGGFKNVVVSGHGEEGTVYMTGADGTAVGVDGETLAGMFADTTVENVFLNVCHGAGGQKSVANALAEVGLNAMGWTGAVQDDRAGDTAAAWASLTGDGGDVQDLDAVADQHGDLVVQHEQPPAPVAPAAPAVEPALYQWDTAQYMWV